MARENIAAPKVTEFVQPAGDKSHTPQSDSVAWQLLDLAYADPVALWAYLVLIIVIGVMAVDCMRDVWAVGWACSGLCLATAGLLNRHAYPARKQAGRLRAAQRRFRQISALDGVYWGAANLVLLLSSNTLLQFWLINAETAVLGLVVARLNPMRAAIKLEVMLAIIPLVICCLLTGNGYFRGYAVLGVLYLFSTLGIIDDLHGQTVRRLAAEEANAALLRSVAETNASLAAANDRLEAMATTDGLTGIPNRRRFDEAVLTEWHRATRAGTSLAVLLIDIDHFKSYNDTLGHLAGDSCLRLVAETLATAIRRSSDLVTRYGGEEFAAIICDSDAVELSEIAERLRVAIEDLAMPSPAGGYVTVSIGGARCFPATDQHPATHIAALITQADKNLYAAKGAGRNRIRTNEAKVSTSFSGEKEAKRLF